MEGPGQTALSAPSHQPDRIQGLGGQRAGNDDHHRDPRMFTPYGNCYRPRPSHRSCGPTDVVVSLAEQFSSPAPEPPQYPEREQHVPDRTSEFGEVYKLNNLDETMGTAQ